MSEFVENPRGAQALWAYFLKSTVNEQAKCKKCNVVLKIGGGSTSGLHKHLQRVHKINVQTVTATASKRRAEEVDVVEGSSNSKLTCRPITSFMRKDAETLPLVLSRMAALDGLAFRVFITSTDIRLGLEARGFRNIPLSANTIRQHVLQHAQSVRESVKREFKRLKVTISCNFSSYFSHLHNQILFVSYRLLEIVLACRWMSGLLIAVDAI